MTQLLTIQAVSNSKMINSIEKQMQKQELSTVQCTGGEANDDSTFDHQSSIYSKIYTINAQLPQLKGICRNKSLE